ncbi:MAG: ABC transporter permease [Acidobacteria bacterium]|nr:ABC transporter permease [Acidobacteriota bacterium]
MKRLTRVEGAALAVLGLIVLSSLAGPSLVSFDYREIDLGQSLQAPGWTSRHWMGTDLLGRDQLARILQGGRISALVALVGTGVACLIGIPYGAVAGWFSGRLDSVMMRLVDLLYAIPYMFLVMLVMALLAGPEASNPRRMILLFLMLGAVSWLTLARIVRGQVLTLRRQPFIEAALAMGAGPGRILSRHLIPNTAGIILTYATLTLASVILQEAFLSFLGLGIRPPMTTWGALLNDGVQAMAVAPWLVVFPAGFLIATLLCLHLLGEGLQDRMRRTG